MKSTKIDREHELGVLLGELGLAVKDLINDSNIWRSDEDRDYIIIEVNNKIWDALLDAADEL